MATKSISPPPEPEPESPPDVPEEAPPEPEAKPARSAMDDPAHPLHHLRNA